MYCVSLFRVIVFACLVIVVSASDSASATIYVATIGSDTSGSGSATAPYASIQKAIDSAADGDKVVVAPGTYEGPGNRNINLQGKRITVTSSGDELNTILDLGGSRGFIASSTENEDTVISNLTISNGYAETSEDWGGTGIIDITTPAGLTIRNCIFKNNEVKSTYLTSNAQVINKQEHPENLGAVVNVENCLFYDNKIYGGAWMGWSSSRVVGISGAGDSTLKPGINVRSCTIYGNTLTSYNDSGGMVLHLGRGVVENSIIFNNSPATNGRSAYATATSYSVADIFIYSTFTEDVLEGYLNVDPGFVDPASGNFRLLGTSQALNAGDPSLPPDPDGSRADIGYKFPDIRTAQDTDNDGVNDYREYKDGTDPNDPNSFNPLSRGLVAYYPLKNSYADESGLSNNLENPSAGITFACDRFGQLGGSLSLAEKQDQVISASKAGISANQANSISLWFYADQVPDWNGNYEGSLLVIRDHLRDSYNVGEEHRILIDSHNGNTRLSSHGSFSDFYAQVPHGSLDKQWHHLLIVYTGALNTSAIYLNGGRLGVFSDSGYSAPRNMADGFIHFGRSRLHTGSYADGVSNTRISDVRIYNRALDDGDAKQLYYAESFTMIQRSFLEGEAGIMGHYSQSQYNASRTEGQTDVTTNTSAFGLFTQTQFDANRTNGRSDVTTNPSAFGLFTQVQYDANRTNGRTDVTTNPSAFGLFTQLQYDANRTSGIQSVIANVPSVNFSAVTSTAVRAGLGASAGLVVSEVQLPEGWFYDASTREVLGRLKGENTVSAQFLGEFASNVVVPMTINFTPLPAPPITAVSLSPSIRTVKAGRSAKLVVFVANNSTQKQTTTIEFSSSNEDVLAKPANVTVTVRGRKAGSLRASVGRRIIRVQGIGVGEADLTAIVGDVSSDPCAVRVK